LRTLKDKNLCEQSTFFARPARLYFMITCQYFKRRAPSWVKKYCQLVWG